MVRPTEERVRHSRAEPGGAYASPATQAETSAAQFTALVERERHHVYRLVCRLLGRSEEAEDVLQDVLTKAWLQWDHVRGLDRPGAWLQRVAINACRQRMRRWKLWRNWFQQARPTSHTEPPTEQNERVRWGIAQLPHADREVLVLRYLEELETEDMLQLLGVRRAALDARLHRARQRLGQLLGDPHA